MTTPTTQATGNGQDTQTNTGSQTTPKTFTQEEVNALMGRTRQEERGKFADYETLKEKAAAADAAAAAQLSKEERLAQEKADFKARLTATEQRIAETAIAAEIRVKAASMGIVDPDAALALINRKAVSFSDGNVTGVDDALAALVEAKPYLKGQSGKPAAPNLNANGGKAPPATPQLSDLERDFSHRFYPELSHTDAELRYAKSKASAPNRQ